MSTTVSQDDIFKLFCPTNSSKSKDTVYNQGNQLITCENCEFQELSVN